MHIAYRHSGMQTMHTKGAKKGKRLKFMFGFDGYDKSCETESGQYGYSIV